MKIRMLILFCLMATLTKATETYTQVMQAGGFGHQRLRNLHTLDLSNTPGIDDNFINNNLVNNQNLVGIKNLNLSGNTGITMASINSILNDQYLGSMRDLPQESSTLGCPSSTINIYAINTSVVSHIIEEHNYFTRYVRNFTINYLNPATYPTRVGAKFLEVRLH